MMYEPALISSLDDIVYEYAVDTDFVLMHSNIMYFLSKDSKK